jgi:hypothetical protein
MSENNDIENAKSSILYQLYSMLFEIDVSKEGVCGAKNFFEAKVKIFFKYFLFYFMISFRQLQLKKAINFNEKFVTNKNNDVLLKRRKFVEN